MYNKYIIFNLNFFFNDIIKLYKITTTIFYISIMENEHVHNVYNLIYNKFDKTRTYG